jgi:hypothetical protein
VLAACGALGPHWQAAQEDPEFIPHPSDLMHRHYPQPDIALPVGRVDEAVTLYERTLADRQRILGVDHPDTLISRNNLANAQAQRQRQQP